MSRLTGEGGACCTPEMVIGGVSTGVSSSRRPVRVVRGQRQRLARADELVRGALLPAPADEHGVPRLGLARGVVRVEHGDFHVRLARAVPHVSKGDILS